ncbi:hypothetical protein [Bullifex porci]|uniref:hypothetical protein n=1 Tax=Bullifex porci TaxID=2606638 RepID=UPI0023F15644|nr:hypothetical protein [Bullifex porci]MDD7254418.1 hypothetical protein [Bullifex porci]
MNEAAADELENSISSVVIQSFNNADSTEFFLFFEIAAGQDLVSGVPLSKYIVTVLPYAIIHLYHRLGVGERRRISA